MSKIINKSFLIGIAIGLIIGISIAQLKTQKSPLVELSSSCSKQEPKQEVLAKEQVGPSSPSPHNTTEEPVTAKNAATGFQYEKPNQFDGKQEVVKAEFDRKLEQLTRERAGKGEILSQWPNQNGGTYSKERLADGTDVSREYNSRGTLTGEQIILQGGEEIDRSFFESGAVKGLKWKFPNGTIVYSMQDSSGVYTSRTDEFPNGDRITYEFDDSGNITKRWYIKKGQPPVLQN